MSVEMKDSGIAWIGEIPVHWNIAKTLYLLSMPITDGPHETPTLYNDGIPFISAEAISGGEIDFSKKRGYISESYYKECCKKYIPQLEDIYMIKSGATTGRVAMVKTNDKFTIWSPLAVFRANNSIVLANYLFYAVKSESYLKQVENNWSYGTQQNIGMRALEKLIIAFPPKEEQSRIANFLDKKCAEIDELIALQEQMIAQLTTYKQAVITETVTKGLDPNVKMKDSGVEWIGEIPEHWDVKRIKNVCNCFGRIGFRGYTNDDMVQEGEGAITLSPSNMKNMTMDYSKCSYLSWNKYYESPEIQIQVGDVLFVKTGSTYGKSSYVHEIPMECTINPQIICFKDHRGSAKFLNYLLNTPMAKGQVDITVVGGTIPTIAQSKIINYSFAFPPLSEQQSIAQHLDQKCKEIDELISIKKEKIEQLKSYKKSVIYEYVTGKKQID